MLSISCSTSPLATPSCNLLVCCCCLYGSLQIRLFPEVQLQTLQQIRLGFIPAVSLQVFELWQRRQILKASVVTPALQLLAKLKAEHDLAQAASLAELTRLGQTGQGRRPLRVNLPCAPPGSLSGLPTHIMHLMVDQWASLSGFRC